MKPIRHQTCKLAGIALTLALSAAPLTGAVAQTHATLAKVSASATLVLPASAKKVDALKTPTTKTLHLRQKTSYQLNIGAYLKNKLTKQKVSYTSSDPKVATVSAAGKIRTAAVKKATKVTITAKAASKSLTITLWVVTKAVSGKATAKIPSELQKGKTDWVRIDTGKNTNPKIVLSSTNKKVATVNKYGQIKALKKGTTKITVTVGGKKGSKTLKVTE